LSSKVAIKKSLSNQDLSLFQNKFFNSSISSSERSVQSNNFKKDSSEFHLVHSTHSIFGKIDFIMSLNLGDLIKFSNISLSVEGFSRISKVKNKYTLNNS
jgi:hypothetical protein